MYKNQQSRQTGSRNLTGSTTLPTIWGTYIKLVTKYQISAINSCWEKCDKISWTDGRMEGWKDRKTDGRMDGRTEGQTDGQRLNSIHPSPPGSGFIKNKNCVYFPNM